MEEECKSATLKEQRTNAVADESVPQSNPISKKLWLLAPQKQMMWCVT